MLTFLSVSVTTSPGISGGGPVGPFFTGVVAPFAGAAFFPRVRRGARERALVREEEAIVEERKDMVEELKRGAGRCAGRWKGKEDGGVGFSSL